MVNLIPTPRPGNEAYAFNLAAATYRRMFGLGPGAPLDGDDLWGAALLGAARALERWDPHAGVSFQVFAIGRIRAEILDALRTQQRHAPEIAPECDDFPSVAWEPLKHLDWRLLVERLPPRERAVIRAAYWEGRTMAEVAQEWKRHPTRLRQLKAQAEQRLARWAQEAGL